MGPRLELSPKPDQTRPLLGLLEHLALNDLKPEAMLEAAAERLAAFLGDTCIASLLTEDQRWLRPLGLADPDPEVARVLRPVRGARWRADRGFTRRVLESLRALRLPETSPEVVIVGRPELADYGRRFGITSLIVAPMRVGGSPVGNIAVIRRRRHDPHTPHDEAVTQAVADLVGLGASSSTRQPEGGATTDQLPPDITSREREVLALLAAGHTNREIAEKLVLSVRTVEWHRARLQWKLGVTGRAALVDLARAHGVA